MKPHFYYSSDIYGINAESLAGCCVHLICLEGGGSFVFNGKGFSLTKKCILVVPNPAKLRISTPPKTLCLNGLQHRIVFLADCCRLIITASAAQ